MSKAPETVTSRPRVLTWVCIGVAVLLVVMFSVVAVALGAGDSPARFRLTDQIAMAGLGVLLAVVVLGFTRARVDADQTGVDVRNLLGSTRYPWQVVIDVRLEPGAPWASLVLQDDETVAMLGIQASDGDRAVDAVVGMRTLLAHSRRGPGER